MNRIDERIAEQDHYIRILEHLGKTKEAQDEKNKQQALKNLSLPQYIS